MTGRDTWLRRALPVGAWGLFLLVLAAVSLIFKPDKTTLVLAFALAAAAVTAGLSLLQSQPRPRPEDATEVAYVPDLSFATVVAAIGLAVAISGTAIGPWLLYIGLGVLAAGLAGIVREVRAERREQRLAPGPGELGP
jgi:Mn2+/Fe2+ NRAMP family transporter